MTRVVPLPRWWMWRPGADPGPAAAVARRRVRWARVRPLPVPAALVAWASVVVGPTAWWSVGLACVPVSVVALVALLPVRVTAWQVASAADADDVVHAGQFTDVAQRRRAGRLCADFDLVRDLEPRRVAHVERLLWGALAGLRGSLVVREALRVAENRPGLATAVAETTRELADLDARVDRFAAALRVLAEESTAPECDDRTLDSALRRVAALDPI